MPWHAVPPESLDEADYREHLQFQEEFQTAAIDARSLQELRGIFIGQVAEAEAVLARTVIALGPPKASVSNLNRSIETLRKNSKDRGLDSPVMRRYFGHLDWLRERRNQLIHATIDVGVVRTPSGDSTSVISMYLPIRDVTIAEDIEGVAASGDTVAPTSSRPEAEGPEEWWATAPGADLGLSPPDSQLITEHDLQVDTWRAWVATRSAVLIARVLAPDC